MKHSLKIPAQAFLLASLVLIASLVLPGLSLAAPATAPVDLATSPLATSTVSTVKPNLLFVLDNSGSMDWDHMPDDASDGGSAVTFSFGYYGLRSSQCNQVYYNPSVTYLPPVNASGANYPDASFTAALVNGFDTSTTPATVNLDTNYKALLSSAGLNPDSTGQSAYYYSYSGTQDTQLKKNYNSTTNAFFKECSDSTGSSTTGIAPVNGVKALVGGAPSPVGSGVFSKYRLATTETTTIVVSGPTTTTTSVSSIKVNNVELMSGPSVTSTNTNTVATNIAAKITLNGFSATASGSIVTITGPTSAANYTPVIIRSGSMTLTADVFPDTTAANRTNFANWYSYYRTRLLMMKTAAGRAFSGLTNYYRVGLMKISSSATPAVAVGTFEGAQRNDWYSTLYSTTTSGSTPLRTALSNAGRYYAGVLGGVDPVQYSCQQNFSILSTDGYWNAGDGFKMDGSTAVGNQDGPAGRPYNDGAQAGTTVTSTYTRNTYSKVSCGWGTGKSKLQTQPENGVCSVTTVNGVTGSPSCTWTPVGAATSGSCASTSTITLPNPNPSTPVLIGTLTTPGSTGGTQNTLADVAMYYYNTDLRPGTCTLCTDNVFTSSTDNQIQQHMTTFTLGLGASGWMNYSSSYLSSGSNADYDAVSKGSTADSAVTPPVCSWQPNGTVCTWPIPGMTGSDGWIANVDDLWHAAVDGHGAYFSATSPQSLSAGLANALAGINARKGSAAAAAASTLNPVVNNNSAYVASYTTVTWKGNLEARGINTVSGVVSENADWCVEDVVAGTCALPGTVQQDVVAGDTTIYNCVTPNSSICTGGTLVGTDCKVPVATACTGKMKDQVNNGSRKIWTKGPTAATLDNFRLTGGDLSGADFDTTKLSGLSQWSSLTGAQHTAAAGNGIVSFLRGQKDLEDSTGNTVDNRLFRYREATLGDAIDSQPAYIGTPTFSYTDAGYAAFKSDKAARPGTVYMGANDGMMHAFDAATGVERWAYVPSMVIPNMFALADKNYATNHAYYADGSPIISDVNIDGQWRTILVAGLNGGGRGYYALDITVPEAPTLLWEFTSADDPNLGYTFGNPVITKMDTGKWVVLVTSGYNNIPDASPRVKYPHVFTGNGQGYLYVLDAKTGKPVGTPIGTGVGNASVPSGLAQIATWADEPEKNNTATFTYGGDLLGNVWRFDINKGTVVKFAVLKEGTTAQPITTRPELGTVLTSDGKMHRVVFIGTGKYLEKTDLEDTQQQTLYAIKDDDTVGTTTPTPTLEDPRNSAAPNHLVQQFITNAGSNRTVSENPVDFKTDRGWFVDFKDPGERQNVASQLVLGTLLVPTTVPSNTVCSPGGTGWLNYFNYTSGGAINTSNHIVSTKASSPIVGVNVMYIQDSSGKPKPVVSTVTSDDPTPSVVPAVPFPPSGSGFQKKRVIWRELIQ